MLTPAGHTGGTGAGQEAGAEELQRQPVRWRPQKEHGGAGYAGSGLACVNHLGGRPGTRPGGSG